MINMSSKYIIMANSNASFFNLVYKHLYVMLVFIPAFSFKILPNNWFHILEDWFSPYNDLSSFMTFQQVQYSLIPEGHWHWHLLRQNSIDLNNYFLTSIWKTFIFSFTANYSSTIRGEIRDTGARFKS